MIITQFLRAFPDSHVSYGGVDGRDAWTAFLLHGPMYAGMREWFNAHGLQPHQRVGLNGYDVRWLTAAHLHGPRLTTATVLALAAVPLSNLGFIGADGQRVATDTVKGYDRHFAAFETACQEAGLA